MNDSGSRRTRLADPEMLAALSAVVIGLCALIVAIYEVRIMRADQRSSVLPLVELSRATLRSPRANADSDTAVVQLMFRAENVGIGPAKLVDFRVIVDGSPQSTWGEAVQTLLGRDEAISYGNSTIVGRTLPAGSVVEIFRIQDTALANEIELQMDRLDLQACFCSVFDECWTTGYHDYGEYRDVRSCEAGPASFRE